MLRSDRDSDCGSGLVLNRLVLFLQVFTIRRLVLDAAELVANELVEALVLALAEVGAIWEVAFESGVFLHQSVQD